jgi:hypothetical protein
MRVSIRTSKLSPIHTEPLPAFKPDHEQKQVLLQKELSKRLAGEVRFDAASKAIYATDASNYRQVPIGVVICRTQDDVVQALAAWREYGAPVLSRRGGTSLAGQCCNAAVVIDWSKFSKTTFSNSMWRKGMPESSRAPFAMRSSKLRAPTISRMRPILPHTTTAASAAAGKQLMPGSRTDEWTGGQAIGKAAWRRP